MTKINVARPAIDNPPTPESLTREQARSYRDGKHGLTVYLCDDGYESLTVLKMNARKALRRRVSFSDLLSEAIDDYFEKHGEARHFGTQRRG
jgi:hypothetical protein